jgi:2-polyprenyl-3-methyl-5-hydroxy-6-metoxy-1,4-benzoquinol methylase
LDFHYGKDVSLDFINEKLQWNSKYYLKMSKKFSKISKHNQKKCYICSESKSNIICSFFGIKYLKCQKCGHAYTDRRLSNEQLIQYYSKDQDYFSNFSADKKLLKLRKQITIPKIKHIKKYSRGAKWLDIGAGDGTFVSSARSEGIDCNGLEISKSAREHAQKYYKIKLSDEPLEEFATKNKEKWDVISFIGVLEHMTNPVKALRTANGFLKKNGIVAIEVPNFDCLSTYFQKLTQVPDRHLLPYAHIMVFSQKSAEFMLRSNGFEPISIWYWGMDMIELLKYMKLHDKNFESSELCKILSEKLNEMQLIFDRSKMADEFLIIGKKVKSI